MLLCIEMILSLHLLPSSLLLLFVYCAFIMCTIIYSESFLLFQNWQHDLCDDDGETDNWTNNKSWSAPSVKTDLTTALRSIQWHSFGSMWHIFFPVHGFSYNILFHFSLAFNVTPSSPPPPTPSPILHPVSLCLCIWFRSIFISATHALFGVVVFLLALRRNCDFVRTFFLLLFLLLSIEWRRPWSVE